MKSETNYGRVYAHIVQQIRDGKLNEGDKLPSITELASDLGVGLSSVKVAQMMLREYGVISGHQGKGTYVTAYATTFLGSVPDAA